MVRMNKTKLNIVGTTPPPPLSWYLFLLKGPKGQICTLFEVRGRVTEAMRVKGRRLKFQSAKMFAIKSAFQ